MVRLTLIWLLSAVLGMLAPAAACARERAPLIVISIDGFRADYFGRGETPALAELAADGVHARAMRPAFPSVTEPNHYTLMTGLWPDHHGIVDNTMVDPAMPGMSFGGPHSQGMDDDPRWWNGATPLWVTAERAGIPTASSQWPSDTAVVQGVKPTLLEPRKGRVAMAGQAQTVLAWLDLPAAQRPGLIRLHLGDVDDYGHVFGPDHALTNAKIREADAAVGALIAGLRQRGLYDRTNIVVVSDHGMTAVSPKRVILFDDLIDLKAVVVTTEGATGGVNPLPGREAEIAARLLVPHDHYRCWRKADIPAQLHYGANRRAPQILCLADLGWTLGTRAGLGRYPPLFGNHGYDPAEPDMAALFIAHGPAFARGVTLPVFDNVDVYPLLARVLGVKALPGDGHLSEVAAALR